MSEETSHLASARAAASAGNKREARELLQKALRKNPQDYRAWLWLAGLGRSPQESLKFIERAERIRPGDPTVARARSWAESRLAQQQTDRPREAPAEPSAAAPAADPPQQRPPQEQVVEKLRQRSQATQKKPRRRRFYAASGLILLLSLVLAAAFIWGQALPSFVANRLNGEATVAAPVETATATAESAERFVSGQFLAKESAGPASDQPTPTATATAQPLAPKTASKAGNEPRPTWTMTPSPTYTPTPTATPAPTFVSDGNTSSGLVARPAGVGPEERWVDVNLTTQTLVAYEGDTPVFDSPVSSGTWQYPTVTGQFRVWLRYREQTMDGRRLGYDYYLPNVPYVMYFYEDYALHGTYWHNNFGTPMSHGCVNLPTPAAEWIFNWSSMGTLVNVHY